MMLAAELRKKTSDDLRKELNALLKEQLNLRMQKGLGESPRPSLYKRVRKDIARVKTILREMEK